MFMPFQILGVWFRVLLAFALIGGGITLLALWNRSQQDWMTRYLLWNSPAVVARGFLAMFRYDAM